VDFGGVGFLGAYLAACVLASRGASFGDSINHFDRAYRLSDCGKTYAIFVIYFAVNLFVVFYHNDKLGGVESSLKQLAIAYSIFFHIKKYDIGTIFIGAAIGAVFAALAAFYELGLLEIPRPGGVTNPIRFGMIAGLFGVISVAGFLFARNSRSFTVLTFVGAIAGIAATILSGSRGAAIAVPLMLLLLLLRLWRQSKPIALTVLAAFMLVAVPIIALETGKLRERTSDAVEDVSALWEGQKLNDESVHDRVRLLELSMELFREYPLLGAGTSGWEESVDKLVDKKAVSHNFNQAHNQFANDFAKGGLVLGLGGLALIFVPMFFFLRSKPFENGEASLAAFVGFITCVGFAAFCLTESVMVLSLPSCIYAILVCYLLAAKSKPANTTSF
jgi:O-antigen ligase